MAGLDTVMDDFKTLIVTGIAPLQPNLFGYPNSDLRAGTIVPTLITVGHPIQYHVLERMENSQAQVTVYDTGVGKPMPYVNQVQPLLTSTIISGAAAVNYQLGRSLQQLVVEVWAPTRPDRQTISDAVRQLFGDAARIHHADGSTTTVRYLQQKDWDEEQVDTIYVRRLYYSVDYVEVTSVGSYVVTEAISTLSIEVLLS